MTTQARFFPSLLFLCCVYVALTRTYAPHSWLLLLGFVLFLFRPLLSFRSRFATASQHAPQHNKNLLARNRIISNTFCVMPRNSENNSCPWRAFLVLFCSTGYCHQCGIAFFCIVIQLGLWDRSKVTAWMEKASGVQEEEKGSTKPFMKKNAGKNCIGYFQLWTQSIVIVVLGVTVVNGFCYGSSVFNLIITLLNIMWVETTCVHTHILSKRTDGKWTEFFMGLLLTI